MKLGARRTAWGTAAIACALAVTAPPLDRLADASFAWHMAQHLAMAYAVAFALLLADPFAWWMRVAGKPAVRAAARVAAPLRCAAHPAVALAFFTAVMWFVHFSGAYERALDNGWAHVAEHLAFGLAGLLFWLPILSPAPLKPLNFPARLLYCAVLLPQSALVAMAVGAAQQPLYAHYAALLGSAGAVADQRNAAAVMWVGGGFVGFCAFLGTLAAWARRETRIESAGRTVL